MKTVYNYYMGKSFIIGIGAAIALLTLYFTIMLLAQASLNEALRQLYTLRLWVTPLVITFGIQVGLYSYVKDCNKRHMVSGKSTTVSTATSTTAMIACCAHHLTDILPIIGLSLVSTFLARYQVWFLAVGIASNLVGIGILSRELRKMGSYEK